MTREELIARLMARIHGLVDKGSHICEDYVPDADMPRSCKRCGYEADLHLLRDALVALSSAPALPAEIVICAAIKLPDGRIIRGHRHGDCLRTAGAMPGVDPRLAVQGFMTSRNRFVDRIEGLDIQLAAGIPSAALKYGRDYGTELFSEDVY